MSEPNAAASAGAANVGRSGGNAAALRHAESASDARPGSLVTDPEPATVRSSAPETPRILLSPPHMSGGEARYIDEAFASNWIAPLGPNVDGFESEFCAAVGSSHSVALSSGTAALHLALILAGVQRGDEVLVSTLTFCASANPVAYLGARPVFVDSEHESWNIDPDLVCAAIEQRVRTAAPPRAVIVVHLYGQTANLQPIVECCERHGVFLIEDAAEALGARWMNRSPGTIGRLGVFSFNGNKIITTSGGGMLVSDDESLILRARKLATQARDPAPHYQHSDIGYNYRMSNVLAGIGRAQLQVLAERVAARRRNFEHYESALRLLPGIDFMPEAPWGEHNRWLTTLTIEPEAFGKSREEVRIALEERNIESRPVWKPMHMQPVFQDCEVLGGRVAEQLFRNGLCLPSGSQMTLSELERVSSAVSELHVGR